MDKKVNFLNLDSGNDSGPIFNKLPKILKQYGLFVCQDPMQEGSSTYGIIISDKPLNKKEVFIHCMKYYQLKESDLSPDEKKILNG